MDNENLKSNIVQFTSVHIPIHGETKGVFSSSKNKYLTWTKDVTFAQLIEGPSYKCITNALMKGQPSEQQYHRLTGC